MAATKNAYDALVEEIRNGYFDDGEPVMKSLRVITSDGSRVEALDASEHVAELLARISDGEEALVKALAPIVDLLKSTTGKVAKIAKARRAAAPSMPADEFFSRALAAQAAGKVSGLDIAKAEACLARGLRLPDEIVEKVLGDETYKALPAEMSYQAFMDRAEAALAAGKVTHLEFSRAQAALMNGRQPAPAFLSRLLFGHSGTLAA
ncbi:MAG TPA: hypothetical protein VGM72_00360 [Micropepsaceae bacterium]|jgi:hypothetical protein